MRPVALKRMVPVVVASAALAGCAATVPEDAGFPDVERIVSERIPQRVVWNRNSAEDAAVHDAIEGLLTDELASDEAVQIALLNNRGLQATYEDLGVAQADLVEAGLLSNPIFSGRVLWTFNPEEGAEIGLSIVQNFLDLLMLPARERLADVEFQEAKLGVAAEVLELAAETREAYHTYQAAEQTARVLGEIARSAQASYDLARRQDEAGNISERELTAEQVALAEAKVELVEAQAAAYAERERLTRLMGLWGTQTRWTVPDSLPDLPEDALPFQRIEALAIAGNLDLAAARRQNQALATALGVARDFRWLGDVEAGLEYEVEADDQEKLGPSIAFGLPIFNQGQPEIARAAALLRQSENRVAQMAIEIRSEVRAVRDQLIRTRDLAEHYRDVVIPLNQRLVRLTLQEYNYMFIGPFEVLSARQSESDAYRRYIEAIRDWWIARSDMERLLSGRTVPGSPLTLARITKVDVHGESS